MSTDAKTIGVALGEVASSSQASVAATTTTTATTTALQTDLDALRTLVLAMRTALINANIIKGSA